MTTLKTVQNFINGEFVPCANLIDSFDPATGKVWAKVPDSSKEEVDDAVKAAKQAFSKWSCTSVEERSRIANKIADLIEERIDELAELESHDQGKPVWLAKAVDIPRAVQNFRAFARCILHLQNRSTIQDKFAAINYTVREPAGVVGMITPWNLPLYLLTFKLAPAIVCGNTVVAKPSEMTSVSAQRLCEIFNAAGLPPGVINVVFGTGPKAGHAIVSHPDIPLITFTGGSATAEKLRVAAAPFSKKFSMELGGKNAAIVFEDTDLDKCTPTCIRSSFMNQGEICLCTSRIFVQKSIYDNFVNRFVKAARDLKVGDPKDKETFTGALISKEHLAKVKGYVDIARAEGAMIQCGDGVEELILPEELKDGYFMRPTVITQLPDNSRLMKEEIFGPVTCIVPFETEEEVIQRANEVKYGLAATLWTKDVSRLHRVAHKLQAGTIWANCWLVRDLNMPFGGMKESGIGREGVKDSFDFFMEEKTICLQL